MLVCLIFTHSVASSSAAAAAGWSVHGDTGRGRGRERGRPAQPARRGCSSETAPAAQPSCRGNFRCGKLGRRGAGGR